MFYTKALLASLPVAAKMLPAAPEDPAAEKHRRASSWLRRENRRGADTGV